MSLGFHDLTIKRVVPETALAVCVYFDVPSSLEQHFAFTPGQYLTLETELSGETLRRSYSICCAPHETELRVAIKKVRDGVFSSAACESFKAGDVISVLPPLGNFGAALDVDKQRNYLCIGAGSGITPIISIIKSVLALEPDSRVTLIYGNQKITTMMFRDELCGLKNAYLERFHWINVLSREQQEAEVLNGRIDNRKGAALIGKHLITIADYHEFFLCGPEAMISEVSRGLRGEGIGEERIHYELFYADAEDAARVIAKHHARALEHAGRVSQVAINLDGRTTRFDLGADGSNLLDAALEQGLDVPFSCKGGVCATCKARLVAGKVDMDLNHALGGQELAEGYILTCQAHPVSERVTVDFDQT